MKTNGVQVDTISKSGGQLLGSGNVAQKLLASNFNVNSLRTLDVLRKDEWLHMDNVLIEIARKKLVITQMLRSMGLTYSIPNGLGTTALEWERITDMDPANVSMSGITEGDRDRLEFDLQSQPLPIIHKDFQLNIRHLEASRTKGMPLDTAHLAAASTMVTERVEEMIFDGHAIQQGGTGTIYGILNHPQRNTGALGTPWLTATGESMLDDVIAMMSSATEDNMYGPYVLFIPQAVFHRLADDFKANSDKSIMTRLMETPGLSGIFPTKDIGAGDVIMAQMTSDVMDEIIGLEPTIVSWETNGGFTFNFKVMTIMVPRVRSTITNQSGIVHYS